MTDILLETVALTLRGVDKLTGFEVLLSVNSMQSSKMSLILLSVGVQVTNSANDLFILKGVIVLGL